MKVTQPGVSLSTTTPTAETVGIAGAVGTAGTAADGAHAHALARAASQPKQLISAVAAIGTGTAPSSSDHVHDLGMRQLLLAADLVKTADTALANVTGASFAIAANEEWDFEFRGQVGNTVNGGMKFDVTGPAAPTIAQYELTGGDTTTDTFQEAQAFSTALAHTPGALTFEQFVIRGHVKNGANAGTVQIRFAAGNAAGVTTLLAGASGYARKAA